MTEALLALLAGLLAGSFLNVCIYRWPRDLSVVRPRSFCPACEHTIAWYDNIPIVSFVALGARCRHCRHTIPFRYPIVELMTGLLFFLAVLVQGPSPAGLKLCVFSALLIGLVFSDLEERILPDEMTIGGTVIGIALAAFVPFEDSLIPMLLPADWDRAWVSVIEAAAGAVISSGLLWVVGTLYLKIRKREGLGLGDVKMVAMIGAFLGLQGALLTVILGSVLGSVLGLLYILVTRKDASTYELPFGTFLGAAALAIAFLRAPILSALGRLAG